MALYYFEAKQSFEERKTDNPREIMLKQKTTFPISKT